MTVEMAPEDMTDAEQAAVKLKNETNKQREARDDEARRWALQSQQGRRLLYRVLENCGMFQNCVSIDRDASLVLAGGQMKAVAMWAELIATSPALVGKMIEENAR